MSETKERARELLRSWKGDSYVFGLGTLERLGSLVSRFGKRAMVVANRRHSEESLAYAIDQLHQQGIAIAGDQIVTGAKPNTPREDVYRLETWILHHKPDCVVAIGGGSTIDACKAAIMLATYGAAFSPEVDRYFGTGMVTKAREQTGHSMIPLIAVETAASSGAHLTKYSNITDPVAGQKMLVVDPIITPAAALFDYRMSATMPIRTTLDGALDGIAHTFEAFCGANAQNYGLLEDLTLNCLELTLANTQRVLNDPQDMEAREALGLATDLGGYAIMVGGTSGAHLTSFSLVDLIGHGTACGIMNPYFAVFYAPAIQPQLKVVGRILARYGFMRQDAETLSGRALGKAVAEGFIAFAKSVHAPTQLSQVAGFTEDRVERILDAAKNPDLAMKLKNMPVPLTAQEVDTYLRSVILAAVDGNLDEIINM